MFKAIRSAIRGMAERTIAPAMLVDIEAGNYHRFSFLVMDHEEGDAIIEVWHYGQALLRWRAPRKTLPQLPTRGFADEELKPTLCEALARRVRQLPPEEQDCPPLHQKVEGPVRPTPRGR